MIQPHPYQINNFDINEFLTTYWQQKPCVIRNAFLSFQDPIDEHELAGLAQEETIDARIISQVNRKWQVNFGPFDHFDHLCKGAWSLLVRGVNFHIPEVELLMDAFDFIPHWRKDDVMVSFSTADAGVGPHLDEYDVFIIQGQGSRRWQVGKPGNYTQIQPHPDIAQISEFEPIIDAVLAPGDLIYIPPKFPHNGVALESCMNYSIGFRAPSQQELLSAFADYVLEHDHFKTRYQDPKIIPSEDKSAIHPAEARQIRSLLQSTLDSQTFNDWLGCYTSHLQSVQLPEMEPEEEISSQALGNALQAGAELIREPWTQPTYMEFEASDDPSSPLEFIFYVVGTQYSVPFHLKEKMLNFLNAKRWSSPIPLNPIILASITQMVNAGYWFLDQDPD